MSALSNLIQSAIATQAVDMTETSSGGAGLMPEGYAMARVVQYIELGLQPQEFNGKAKAPAPEIRIGFKLFGDGYEDRFITTFDTALLNNEKAGAKKLFNKLNWKNDMVHFAQALGRAYLVPIKVVQNSQKKDVNRIDIGGIMPPIDPVSKQNYPIPEVEEKDFRYFFFDSPTKETWASLYVEGTWDDGKSKNRTQEKIMSALNFAGSPLEQLISGVVLPDTSTAAPAAAPAPAAEPAPAVAAPAVPAMPAMPAMPSLPTP